MGDKVAAWVVETMEAFGYVGIVFLMFLENVFPPIPSELIMPLAGFTAQQGELSLVGVIIAGIVGSVLGALPFYFVGRLLGAERLRAWTARWGKYFLVKVEDVDLAISWFNRYANLTVLFCRCIPAVRSVISAPAGVAKMNLAVFLIYSTIGMTIWTAILGYLGYALGENWHAVTDFIDPGSKIVVLLVLLFGAGFVIRRLMSMRRPASEDKGAE
jgi:membrane protein DedA with SNARE-associated domain